MGLTGEEELATIGSFLEWGVAGRALPGLPESGDSHVVLALPQGALLAVIDGLGHGYEAALASEAAVRALREHVGEPLPILLLRCHDALRSTRGAVISVARIDRNVRSLQWAGVGNVDGLAILPRGGQEPVRRHLIPQPGVVGDFLPPIRGEVLPLEPGTTLALATDGIQSAFPEDLTLLGEPQHQADRILERYGKASDDALVLVARYLGER